MNRHGLLALEVFVEPSYRFLLSLTAGLVVDSVMLDALDGYQLLDPPSPLVSQDGVVLVVKQLLLLGDDEQLRAILAPADVLDWGVANELLDHRCAG